MMFGIISVPPPKPADMSDDDLVRAAEMIESEHLAGMYDRIMKVNELVKNHRCNSNDVTCDVVGVLCIPLHAKACCRLSVSTVISLDDRLSQIIYGKQTDVYQQFSSTCL